MQVLADGNQKHSYAVPVMRKLVAFKITHQKEELTMSINSLVNDDRFLNWYKMFGLSVLGFLDPQNRPNTEQRVAGMYYRRRLYEFYF